MAEQLVEEVKLLLEQRQRQLPPVKEVVQKSGESTHDIAVKMYSVSPVVKVAVKVKDGKGLPELVDGLKKLSKSDPLVICTTEETVADVSNQIGLAKSPNNELSEAKS